MSELIEVHQLDYKACSLTYGEGACTAEAGTRAAATGQAVFNGSTSEIEMLPVIDGAAGVYEFEFLLTELTNATNGAYQPIYAENSITVGTDLLDVNIRQNSGTNLPEVSIGQGGSSFVSGVVSIPDNLWINKAVKVKITLSAAKTDFDAEVYIDGALGFSGSNTVSRNWGGDAQWGKIANNVYNTKTAMKMQYFRAYKDSVLVRDLPLTTDATDQTGNTTPTATDVTFETVCPDITRDVASFNGSSSYVSLPAFVENDASEYKIEFETVIDFTGNHTFYIEQAGTSTDFILFRLNYSGGLLYARCEITTGAGNQHIYSGFNTGDLLKVSFMVTESQSNASNTDLYIDINGNAAGPLYISSRSSSATKTDGKIGTNTNKIWNFKRYINDVLQNDLPLESDVSDATGNSTPTATDVSFVSQSLSGVDPDNPTLCALQPDPDKKCFNTYATCQDTPNYTATTKTLTFTKQNSALPKESGSTVGFFPSITNSSTQSAELNVGARRFDLNTLGKSSSASITMTDAPYSDNLTDPYVSERTYNPLERGTFWGKFLAQNPYYSGDEYRIYTGEAGQNISDMDYKRYLVDKITLPNSGGSVSISCVDQLRTLDFDKAIFLDAGTITINGSIGANDVDILTNYPVGTTADLPDTLQPYFKLDDEVIKFGNLGQQNGYYKFESCIRAQFGTTATTHDNSTIQLCHYFEKSTVLPSAQAGLYFHLKTLYNDAGFSDSLLDLTGWETEISARLSLYDDVKRLVHEPTPIADLIGELQRDCGFFMWFDEYDKKMKLKAVRPEIEAYSIDEYNHILAGTAQFNVESQDRITELWFSYDMPNKVLSVDNLENYAHTLVSLTDKANPNQYGQRIVHRIKSPWIQSEAQAKRTSNRIVQRYDDSTIFCNFMLDRGFNVRMGQVFKMAHSGTQNPDGSARSMLWQVIGIDRVQDKIKIKAQQFYLDAGYGVWGDNTIPNYSNSTDEQKEKFFYWGITKWG